MHSRVVKVTLVLVLLLLVGWSPVQSEDEGIREGTRSIVLLSAGGEELPVGSATFTSAPDGSLQYHIDMGIAGRFLQGGAKVRRTDMISSACCSTCLA